MGTKLVEHVRELTETRVAHQHSGGYAKINSGNTGMFILPTTAYYIAIADLVEDVI
jgi:hypothetical protein